MKTSSSLPIIKEIYTNTTSICFSFIIVCTGNVYKRKNPEFCEENNDNESH